MKSLYFGGCALTSCVATAILAGCGAGSPGVAPGPLQQPSGTFASPLVGKGFETLHSFKGSRASPGAVSPNDLTALHGVLYGTTRWGGPKAYGTVFATDASGKERVVYRFTGGLDGMYPNGGLTVMNGVLYGTTSAGGNGCNTGPGGVPGCGTVFSVTTSGKERVLHRFKWGSDGASPLGDLTILNGTIYGITWTGGRRTVCADLSKGCGTVFEVSTSGKERILYRFEGGRDGAFPEGTLLALDGKLFGTAYGGGDRGCYGAGCGTIFDVSTSGVEKVLYRFKGGADGENPKAGLISVNGVLYGTASEGGSGCASLGCGTVFEASTSGQENVLFRFKGPPDGQFPAARLSDVNGRLYGTTPSGGKVCDAPSGYDAGTIFELTLSGAEKVEHTFKCWTPRDTDGIVPTGALLPLRQTLYGTTTSGGRYFGGTVFALSF